jgi:hypothetical protein
VVRPTTANNIIAINSLEYPPQDLVAAYNAASRYNIIIPIRILLMVLSQRSLLLTVSVRTIISVPIITKTKTRRIIVKMRITIKLVPVVVL